MGKLYNSRKNLVAKESYSLQEAVSVMKEMPDTKFDESVELHFKLGIDPRHADQIVRGNLTLPNGTGKDIRIICVSKTANVDDLKSAGALEAGCDELVDRIKEGWLDFDLVLASPDAMPVLSKVARVLGPRGLMPSPKNGTITPKLDEAIASFKAGKIEYRNDKTGNVHLLVGKKSFDNEAIEENILAAFKAIEKAKPASSKGTYFISMSLCTTMSPSLPIDSQTVGVKEK